MKTNYLKSVLTVLIILVAVSCSEDEFSIVENQVQKNELSDLKSLSNELDQLNSNYKSNDAITRGKISSTVTLVSADYSGWCVGRWAGFWVGTFTGGLAGMVPGYYIGGAVGGAFCSAATLFDWSKGTPPSGNDIAVFGNQINNLYDNYGILHNQIMTDIYNNKYRYMTFDGGLDSLKLYNRVITLYNNYGYDICSLSDSFRKDLILNCSKYCGHLRTMSPTEANIDLYFNQLKRDFQINDEKELAVLNIGIKTLKTISTIKSDEDLVKYNREVNMIVEKAQLDPAIKYNILSSTSFIANSTLCWK